MKPITCCGLSRLGENRLRVQMQQRVESTFFTGFSEYTCSHLYCAAADLHQRLIRRSIATEEERQTDHSFFAYDADANIRAVLHQCHETKD
jgi:hypothetical protein